MKELVKGLQSDSALGPQIAEALYLQQTDQATAVLDPPLALSLKGALEAGGVQSLWQHQVEGIESVRGCRNVLITTPTASGKSLVFQIPVLEEALKKESGRALFLFPLKALGRDQKSKVDRLAQAAGIEVDGFCEIYDGDTPQNVRSKVKRTPPRVLISNPDMLHLGILSYWQGWEDYLSQLKWVVLDELHTYRGIFGSHFHHVLQRLMRICRSLGAEPVIIASSATASNADEFGKALTGLPFRWISESGAPREGRHLILVRPEASAYTTALQLLAKFLESGLKTIVFTKARRITELLYAWLVQQDPSLAQRVASYRSGFLADERRAIEQRLFDGELDAVISTSALEMGIDIGGLDACILVGYPGSIMATWQRSGRVGRSDRESLTALVALPDALDQYLLDHPAEFVSRPCEALIVDTANEPVTRAHLLCAAAELPLRRTDDFAYLERHAPVVGDLLKSRDLLESADGSELYAARLRPQRQVSLRGTGATSTILNAESGGVVGTISGVRILHECHPGAVYLHAGRQFLVRELDLEGEKVHAAPARLDYFTTPLVEKDTEILEVLDLRDSGFLRAGLGRLLVTERVVGYERKHIHSRQVLDQHQLDLPPSRYETVGCWWVVPTEMEQLLRESGRHFMGSLHASEHAAISLLPLLAVCDRGDIGGISIPLHPQVNSGCVFIYDGHPGGVGIAARGFAELPRLLERVKDLLETCECESGCPACVQSPKCGNGNRPLDKEGARHMVDLLLGLDGSGLKMASAEEIKLMPLATTDAKSESSVERDAQPNPSSKIDEAGAPDRDKTAAKSKGGSRSESSGQTVLFDLETQLSAADVGGWKNAHRMLVAIGVACFLEEGRFQVYREADVPALIADLEGAEVVIGFNIRGFDYKVLSGYTGVNYGRTLPTLDLLEEIHRSLGFRLSLNHLALETLAAEKTADGLQSLEWVQQGRLDLVEEYCRKDVEILRDLYLYGRRVGHVFYRDRQNRKVKLPVEW
jgi:DEAD/DEAH box helicase domain-containing protein